MLDSIPFPMLVLAGGVILAALFFGAWWVGNRRKRRSPAVKSSVQDVPLFGREQAISERVVHATRDAEIEAERLLDKQETLTSLEVRKATVDEVRNATKAIAAKNVG